MIEINKIAIVDIKNNLNVNRDDWKTNRTAATLKRNWLKMTADGIRDE